MNRLFSGIGSKIILPYLLLTLIVAGVGAFIVVNLVTGTLQERFNNQLLDSGRVVAESMVGYEEERLFVLRQVTFTEGVAENLAAGDSAGLASLVPQIIINSPTDAVILLDEDGREQFSWQRFSPPAGAEPLGVADLSLVEDVQLVLQGESDEYGDKRAFLANTSTGPMLYTVGPISQGNELVGAVLVGSDVRKMIVGLTQNAVARVTLYGQSGNVIATTLGDGRDNVTELLQEPPAHYATVLRLLQEAPEKYQVVADNAATQIPLRQVEVLNQNYQLAFGDWRLRNDSFGLFSVALPHNFIVNAAVTSRNQLNVVFTVATIAVILVGYLVARRIVRPLNRLVDVTTAVTEGNLEQRTGIARNDEIGTLAFSFDTMTERLDARTQELIAQKSELAAILHSIADGVIVLDNEDHIVNSNPAARQLMTELSEGFSRGTLHELLSNPYQEGTKEVSEQTKRYEMNGRVLSVSSAPVLAPEGDGLGTVMVLRDITREAEAESLKDNFITGMSHELRTPLTVLKVYSDLLRRTADGHLQDQETTYLDKIIKASHELEQHIQKMISISEIQAGTLSLRKEKFSFTALVQKLAGIWQPQMEKKELSFELLLPEEEVIVYGDTGRLQWAIDNLLSNAWSYTPEGGSVQAVVKLVEVDESEWAGEMGDTTVPCTAVCLEIADSGIGIAQVDQPYIFDRFFRAKNEINFSERGIGLGLFITKVLIDLHNGRISVSSQVGVGSTFTCELPVVVAETAVTELTAVTSMTAVTLEMTT